MRPRLARRGEPGVIHAFILLSLCFNAAPARSPGRTVDLSPVPCLLHRFNAAPARSPGRTRAVLLEDAQTMPASMRPRLACRGEPVELSGDGGAEEELQCGPGSLAGENARFLRFWP